MKLRRATVLTCITLGFVLFPVLVASAQDEIVADETVKVSEGAKRALGRQLTEYKTFTLDLVRLEHQVRSRGFATLRLPGVVLPLHLQPRDFRASNHRSFRTTEGGTDADPKPIAVATYTGSVGEEPSALASFVVLPNLLQGVIRTSDAVYFIDPIRRFEAPTTPTEGHPLTDLVLYRARDVRQGAPVVCGTNKLTVALATKEAGVVPHETSWGVSATRSAVVGTDADYEYFCIYGADTNTVIQGLVGQVSAVYEAELDFKLSVGFQHVYQTANQPYTETDGSLLLDQFQAEWNANHTGETRDLAHLFTGKDLDGNTAGIAYVGVVWASPGSSYGLSSENNLMVKLIAHEIGHNFNATHICSGCSGCPACGGSGPIMCPCLQADGATQFSEPSICMIDNWVTHHAP